MDTACLFSFSRIAMVMKRDIMENWKTNLYRLLSLWGAMALMMVVQTFARGGDHYSNEEGAFQLYCADIVGSLSFIFVLIGTLYASMIMENMRTKEMRVSYLMLPATVVEKYVARFLMVTVVFFVAFVIGLFVAEGIRYAMLPLCSVPDTFHQSVVFHFFSPAGRTKLLGFDGAQPVMEHYLWLRQFCACAFMFWVHSFYIVGGNYWRKNAFLKTFCSLLLAFLVGAFLMVQVVKGVEAETIQAIGEWWTAHLQWMTVEIACVMGIVFFTSFTLFHWWLGYRLFARQQVVQPKFRLL